MPQTANIKEIYCSRTYSAVQELAVLLNNVFPLCLLPRWASSLCSEPTSHPFMVSLAVELYVFVPVVQGSVTMNSNGPVA